MLDLKQFRKIKVYQRKACVICGKALKDPLIRLPKFPLTEFYIKEKIKKKLGFVDQEFHFCKRCGHGQLKNIVDPHVLYGGSYITRTSTSASARWAIDIFLEFIGGILKDRRVGTILEIGCNDLYTLKKLKDRARILYGIDPILKGKEKTIKDGKIRVIGDFFENVDIKKLGLSVDVVLSSHTIEHIENPRKLFQKMLEAGNDETLFFFQFPGLETLVNDAHFDQIFHQHLNYFSLQSVLYLLDEVGGELIDFKINPYHWGTLMIAFRKTSLSSPTRFAVASARRARSGIYKIPAFAGMTIGLILKQQQLFLDSMKITSERIASFRGRTIYGYGAAQMLPVLDYYLDLKSSLAGIIDDDPAKAGGYYLNVPLKIKQPGMIKNIENSAVLVTAMNSPQSCRAIVKRLIELKVERIIIPTNLI